MIPNHEERVVTSRGVAASGEFGLSYKDSAHIMSILRNKTYSDKVLAVLREYGSNAWDAHRMVGKADLPIKVTLPKATDPTLSIRDFGPGLSDEDVFTVYTQYGASTKRNSDATVGMLGIGSKSAFAYSDSFTIVSYHGGMKRMYVAVLDATNKGIINRLFEEPCGDETGVDIRIAVKPENIYEFETKARKIFQHFVPLPEINIEFPAPPPPKIPLKAGVLFDDDDTMRQRVQYYGSNGEWTAVMGCVGYRINLDQVSDRLPRFIVKIRGLLHFDIGEVQVSASREELEYTEQTKTVLVNRFTELVDEYVERTLLLLDSKVTTPWAKRLQAQIFHRLGLPVPESHRDLVASSVPLQDPPPPLTNPLTPPPPPVVHSFRIEKDRTLAHSINVNESTRLLIRDDKRSPKGYRFGYNDYIVYRHGTGRTPFEQIEADLNVLLEERGLTGIPIHRMSTLPWDEPYRKPVDNEKHRLKMFTFKPASRYTRHPLSNNWEPAEREPTDEDVFVILSYFESMNGFNIYDLYREDARIADMLGREMPVVFGYKDTTKTPLVPENCKGIHYPEWHKRFNESLITDELRAVHLEIKWADVTSTFGTDKKRDGGTYRMAMKRLETKDHVILTFLRRHLRAKKMLRRNPRLTELYRKLRTRIESACETTEPQDARTAIEKRYPLLEMHSITHLWGSQGDAWAQYITAIDKVLP